MFYFIYKPQALPGSLKFWTWCFSLTLYTEYEAIEALDTSKLFNDTAGHGPQITPHSSLKYTNFSLENIPPSFYNPQALLESEKNAKVIRFADLVHRVRRDPIVTPRKFLPDTTRHGLRITVIRRRAAVWYFSLFLFEKYQFYFIFIYNPQALLESEKVWTLSFSPTLFTEYEEIQAWHLEKIFFGFFLTKFKILYRNCKTNVFTIKKLTTCPGWLLRKTILEGFQ